MSATNLCGVNEREAIWSSSDSSQDFFNLCEITRAKPGLEGLIVGDVVKVLDLRRRMEPDFHRSRA